jgi:ATP-dependent Zn protease
MQELIKSNVSKFIFDVIQQKLNIQRIHLSVVNNKLIAQFHQDENCIYTSSCVLLSKMEKLREAKQDEKQAIVAVHESGHVVLSAVLFNRIPELVVSSSSSPESDGFMFSRNTKTYFSRHEMIAHAAMLLGGLVAEEIIFGKNYATRGSDSDISAATEFISEMIKAEGLGTLKMRFATTSDDSNNYLHHISECENEISTHLQEAYNLAEKTLQKEKKVLLVLSNELSQKSKLEKDEIEQLIKKHAINSSSINIPHDYYRQKIKAQLSTYTVFEEINEKNPLVVNKKAN